MNWLARLKVITLASLMLCYGCASDPKPQTPKQEAVKGWNDARATVMLSLARDQYNEGHLDKSRDTVNQALSLAPDNALARILSAKLYIEAGQLEPAERELDASRELDAKNAEADYLSGVVYQRWQQPAKALECYQNACDKAPAEQSYVMAKSEMLIGLGRQAEALAFLQSKMDYFEHSAAIRDAIGLLFIQQGKMAEALDMFRHASILAGDDLTIHEHLATALYYNKNYSESAEKLSSLLKETSYEHRADLLMMLGECQFETGHDADALCSFQTAAVLMPNLPGVWLSLAKAQLKLDEVRAADISLHRDMAVNPDNAEAYVLLGYLRLRESRQADALAAFTRANELAANDSTTLCMIGYSLEKLGRQSDAKTYYAQALKQNPTDDLARQLMAGADMRE